ncbi:hypothetical protein [Chitinophaga sp.]|uniref:hypothetical protein n=1 Tax=Chitinophaga sp. TaxID=1869181 RepID=UPI002F93E9C3
MPSASEVIKDGLDLGEMNKKLLQKVEELTLHLIQQRKDLDEALQRVKNLESQNKKMENMIKENSRIGNSGS